MNTDFKVRLTPKDDKTVYSQSLPMPIHLKEDLFVEFALMHKNGIISFTVLKIRKTEETQRKNTYPCGSWEDQDPDSGRLH